MSSYIKVFVNNSEDVFYVECESCVELHRQVAKIIKAESNLKRFRLYWIDKEGDKIPVNSESSYKIFIKIQINNLKIFCEVIETGTLRKTVQLRKCDVCQITTVMPNGSKCKLCQDYDLCSDERRSVAQKVDNNVHQGIECYSCKKVMPIVEDRDKCIECEYYNLCSECERKHVHKPFNLDTLRYLWKNLQSGTKTI